MQQLEHDIQMLPRSSVRLEPDPTVHRAPTPIPPPSGSVLTGDWTRWSYLELGALPSAVPCARLHARQVLWEWGHKDLIEVTGAGGLRVGHQCDPGRQTGFRDGSRTEYSGSGS